MTTLAGGPGVASYNGYTFPPNTRTVGISCHPFLDSSRRTITHWSYDFVLNFKVLASEVGDDSTDLEIADLRKRLTRPRCDFVYTDKGWGTFAPAELTPQQITWGPFPRMIQWKPEGNNQAWDVTWGVTCNVNECDNVVARMLGVDFPLEFNYSVSISKDYAGYQTRTVRGHVIIVNVVKDRNVRKNNNSVDVLKERINPKVPLMFRRVSDDWNVSEDKLRADFNYVDTHIQSYNPLPQPAVKVKASHSFTNVKNYSAVQLQGTLTGSYELDFDADRADSARMFATLMRSRIDEAIDNAGKRNFSVIPVKIYISEPDVYGREAGSFSFTYWVNRSVVPDLTINVPFGGGNNVNLNRAGNLGEVVNNQLLSTGLWKRTPGDFEQWHTSMEFRVWGTRGYGGLRAGEDDYVVDVCARVPLKAPTIKPLKPLGGFPGGKDLVPEPGKDLVGGDGVDPFGAVGAGGGAGAAGRRIPVLVLNQNLDGGGFASQVTRALFEGWGHLGNPETSWIDYSLGVHVNPVDDVSHVKPMPTGEVLIRPASPKIGEENTRTDGYSTPYSRGQPSYAQVRNFPTMIVTLFGRAMRANFPISPPVLESVGGQKVVPYNQLGDGIITGTVASFNCPIVAATWRFRYLVLGVPAKVGPPRNFQVG